MTVESIYAIAIATPNDWLTNLAPVFSMRVEPRPRPIVPCKCDFSRASSKLHLLPKNSDSDWFVALFAHVVIGLSNNLGPYWYFDSHLKTALSWETKFSLEGVAKTSTE